MSNSIPSDWATILTSTDAEVNLSRFSEIFLDTVEKIHTQYSVLGPVVFFMYINNLPEMVK